MVGSAINRLLIAKEYKNIIGKDSKELDLRNQNLVDKFFNSEKPDVVICAAAKVGGIHANNAYPYDFLIDNLQIQNNLITSSKKHNVKKFIFLGSSCIYPKYAKQPLKENYLLEGQLEQTNQWYAIAKISGLKLIESIRKQFNLDYMSLMPTNLYGPNDNFDLKTSHVLPAMIRKFHEAKINGQKDVRLWGTGMAMREFLHVDDLAKAIFLAVENNLNENFYNVGSGKEISIKELANLIQGIIGHQGKIIWDKSMPDGTPRKLLDSKKIKQLGWSPDFDLVTGILDTYEWFKNNLK